MLEITPVEEPLQAVEDFARYAPLTDEQLAAIIDDELSLSLSGHGSNANTSRVEALNYYLRKKPQQTVKGRSTKISPDVSTMVDHTLSQVMESFTQPETVRVLPMHENDREQATIETAYLNWAWFQECNGWYAMMAAFKDALMYKVGISTIDVEDINEPEYMEYEGLTNDEMSAFLDQGIPIEAVQVDGELDSEDVRYDVTIRVDKKKRKVKVREVAPEDFGVNIDHDSIYLHDARFVWERVRISQSDLLEMGIDPQVVAQLPAVTWPSPYQEEKFARNDYWQAIEPRDAGSHFLECYYIYRKFDREGTGKTKRYRILYCDKTILEIKLFDLIPYFVACPFLLPHTFRGESMHDKIRQVQDGKTDLLRIAIDNAINLTYGRLGAVEGMVNMDDLMRPKPSGVVRLKRADGVVPIPTEQLGNLPADMLGYYDKIRRESGGSALDMSGQNLPVNLETAHGAERMISSMEQFVGLIAQSFAHTYLREGFKLLHKMLRRYQPGQTAAVSDHDMVMTDPSLWPDREQFAISIGLSKGERQAMASGLMAMIQQQLQLMQQGGEGVLVNFEKMYNTLYDLGKAIGVKAPGDYFVNPTSPEGQQAAQAKAQAAQAQQQQMQQQQEAQQQFAAQQLKILEEAERTKRQKVENDYELGKLETTADAFHKQDKIANELTEMELEYNQEVPGSKV